MKGKKIAMALIMTLLFLMPIPVKAVETDSFKIKMLPSTLELHRKENLEISLLIDNIKVNKGEKGIGAYEGTIEYDTNVFSQIKMVGNENWDKPALSNGRFSSTNSEAQCVNQTQEIAKITLTVKEDAKLGTTNIVIKDFEGSNKENNVPTEDILVTVKIVQEQSPSPSTSPEQSASPSPSTSPEQSVSPSPESTPATTTSSSPKTTQNTSTDKSVAKNKIPQTGERMAIIILGIGVVIIGGTFYILYKKTIIQ